MLKDPAPGDGEALSAFLTRLAESGRTLDRARSEGNCSPKARRRARQALSPRQRTLAGEACATSI